MGTAPPAPLLRAQAPPPRVPTVSRMGDAKQVDVRVGDWAGDEPKVVPGPDFVTNVLIPKALTGRFEFVEKKVVIPHRLGFAWANSYQPHFRFHLHKFKKFYSSKLKPNKINLRVSIYVVMWGPALVSALLTLLYAYIFCSSSRTVVEEHRLGLLRDLRADIRRAADPVQRCAYWVDHTPYWTSATLLVQASWDETLDWCAWLSSTIKTRDLRPLQ